MATRLKNPIDSENNPESGEVKGFFARNRLVTSVAATAGAAVLAASVFIAANRDSSESTPAFGEEGSSQLEDGGLLDRLPDRSQEEIDAFNEELQAELDKKADEQNNSTSSSAAVEGSEILLFEPFEVTRLNGEVLELSPITSNEPKEMVDQALALLSCWVTTGEDICSTNLTQYDIVTDAFSDLQESFAAGAEAFPDDYSLYTTDNKEQDEIVSIVKSENSSEKVIHVSQFEQILSGGAMGEYPIQNLNNEGGTAPATRYVYLQGGDFYFEKHPNNDAVWLLKGFDIDNSKPLREDYF